MSLRKINESSRSVPVCMFSCRVCPNLQLQQQQHDTFKTKVFKKLHWRVGTGIPFYNQAHMKKYALQQQQRQRHKKKYKLIK